MKHMITEMGPNQAVSRTLSVPKWAEGFFLACMLLRIRGASLRSQIYT